MSKTSNKFLKDLVEAPSPSGFEQSAQEVYRNYVKEFSDEVSTDVHGNVVAYKQGKGKVRLMLVGHADEIGMMVKYIDKNGFIYFSEIGNIDPSLLPGLKLDIYHNGKKIRGIVGKKPIHAIKRDGDTQCPPKLEELWLDIGAKNKKEAKKKVAIGDYITFDKGLEKLSSHLITTKGTDNKAGVFVVGEVLKSLSGQKIDANLYAVSAVQEELGFRGAITSAFNIDPQIGIAIDVCLATDHPGISKNKYGECGLGKGPTLAIGANINPRVFELLKNAARKAGAVYQIEAAASNTGTDTNAIQITRSGVAAGLVSIPNRYMHTPVEVISWKDLEGAVKILTEFVKLINDETNLIPGV